MDKYFLPHIFIAISVACIQGFVLGQILFFGRFIPVIQTGHFTSGNLSISWEEIGAFQYGIFIGCGPFIYLLMYIMPKVPYMRLILLTIVFSLWTAGQWSLNGTLDRFYYMQISLSLIPVGGAFLYWVSWVYILDEKVMKTLYGMLLFCVVCSPFLYLIVMGSVTLNSSSSSPIAIANTVVILFLICYIVLHEIKFYEKQDVDYTIKLDMGDKKKFYLRCICLFLFWSSVLLFQFLFLMPYVYLFEFMEMDEETPGEISYNLLLMSAFSLLGIFIGAVTCWIEEFRKIGHMITSMALVVIYVMLYQNPNGMYQMFSIVFGVFSGWNIAIIFASAGRYMHPIITMMLISVAFIPSPFSLDDLFYRKCVDVESQLCFLMYLEVFASVHFFVTWIYCIIDFLVLPQGEAYFPGYKERSVPSCITKWRNMKSDARVQSND